MELITDGDINSISVAELIEQEESDSPVVFNSHRPRNQSVSSTTKLSFFKTLQDSSLDIFSGIENTKSVSEALETKKTMQIL